MRYFDIGSHLRYIYEITRVTLRRSNTILTTLRENGAEPSRPRAPLLLWAWIRACNFTNRICPTCIRSYAYTRLSYARRGRKKKKKKEKLADSIIVEEVRFPRFCCMYGRIKLVRRSKRREERLVTEARKLNEKSLTVRWSANCNPIFIKWYRVSIPGQHPASKVDAR